METNKQNRTGQQNRALHLYFTLLAKELNEAGLSVQLVLKERMELDFTPDMVKELIWRPVQQAVLKKRSTKALEKQKDIDTVYDHVNRFVSEKFGMHVQFPSHEINYWDMAPRGDKKPKE